MKRLTAFCWLGASAMFLLAAVSSLTWGSKLGRLGAPGSWSGLSETKGGHACLEVFAARSERIERSPWNVRWPQFQVGAFFCG